MIACLPAAVKMQGQAETSLERIAAKWRGKSDSDLGWLAKAEAPHLSPLPWSVQSTLFNPVLAGLMMPEGRWFTELAGGTNFPSWKTLRTERNALSESCRHSKTRLVFLSSPVSDDGAKSSLAVICADRSQSNRGRLAAAIRTGDFFGGNRVV